jgi:PHYB activation tagged suppressor 1
LYWNGATPNVCVADVNVVRQVLSDRTGLYPKNLSNPHVGRLLGKGLVFTEGDDWKRHRKVVYPAFNMDKLKVRILISWELAQRRQVIISMLNWDQLLIIGPLSLIV